MPVGRRVGHRGEFLRRFLKIFRQARAVIRQRTARVKKRDGQRLPVKIIQADSLAQFVGEFVKQERIG